MQLAAAQQYCLTTAGYAPLHEWAKRHTWQMHSPPGEHDLIITPGNNQTIEVRDLSACIEQAQTSSFMPGHAHAGTQIVLR